MDGTLRPVGTLSNAELDQLWKLLKGHAPGDRAEFLATLQRMSDTGAATVKVTPLHVEVTMPLMVAAFDRG